MIRLPGVSSQSCGSCNHKLHVPHALAGSPWCQIRGVFLVVARTIIVWYGWGMDEVISLTSFSSDNLTLAEAFSTFCTVYMPSRNFTQQTRRDYRYDLTEWLAHVAVTSVKSLSTLSIQRYLSHLDERGLKGATRHRKIAAIKTFLRFLEEQHVLPIDFSSSLVWPRVERDEPRPLSPGQYTALLREAATNQRDLAMFETLLQTGIRLSELTGLSLSDVTLPTKPSPDPITGYG